MDAKAQGGTNPLSDILPAHVKQKRIISQMLPFSRSGYPCCLLLETSFLFPLFPVIKKHKLSVCWLGHKAAPPIPPQAWKGVKGERDTLGLDVLSQGCPRLLGAVPAQPGSSPGQKTITDSVWACRD